MVRPCSDLRYLNAQGRENFTAQHVKMHLLRVWVSYESAVSHGCWQLRGHAMIGYMVYAGYFAVILI